jgi:two-component system chemotaxis response regulator CheY
MLALIIDDSVAIRRLLASFVRPMGFEVFEAVDGQDALELLEYETVVPDVALIDWHMPRMNGLEFVREIRTMPRLRPMTRMMVTSESETGSALRALAAGAHEYVPKPCTAADLEERFVYLGLIPGKS